MKKFLMSLPLIALGIGGCATNQPQIIKKTVIYKPSINERKAIAILIYKQRMLENKVKTLEKKEPQKSLIVSKKKGGFCKFNKQKIFKSCKNIDINSFYVAKDNVNIRKCATIHSPVVGTVKRGTEVKFLYCNKYCWCLLNDKRGYVSYKLFDKKTDTNITAIEKAGKQVVETTTQQQHKQKTKAIKAAKKQVIVKNNKNLSKIKKTTIKKGINADEIIKNYINSK